MNTVDDNKDAAGANTTGNGNDLSSPLTNSEGAGSVPGTPGSAAPEDALQSPSLDWSGIQSTESKAKELEAGPLYDPRPKEDEARRNIAYMLILLLCGVVIFIFSLLYLEIVKVAEIKEFSVLIGPLVTLVSAATGFYYGTKSK